MATVSTSGHPLNVQAYLDKHKISILFEDLTSLLVKDQPLHPVDFLISKLQEKKKKSTAGTSRPTSSATGLKKPSTGKTSTSTTGKPAASRIGGITSSTTAAKTVKPATARTTTTRTTTTTKPAGIARPTSSTRTTVGAGSKPVTKPAGTTRPTATKPTSTSTSRLPKSPSSIRSTSTRVGVAPKKGGTTPSKIGTGARVKTKEPEKKTTPVKETKPVPIPVKEEPSKDEETLSETSADVTTATSDVTPATGDVTVTTGEVTPPEPALVPEKEEPIVQEKPKADLGGEEKEREEENEEVTKVGVGHEAEPSDSEGEEDSLNDSGTTLDVEELMRRKRSKKLAKQGGGRGKDHLKELLAGGQEVGVVGNEKEEESEDEGLVVVESHEALEEEGVVVTERDRGMSLKKPVSEPLIDLQVTVCARCAKVIGAEEEGSVVMSGSRLSTLMGAGPDESASQVGGSQVSFPEWEGNTTVSDASQLSLKQKWAITGQSSQSSIVTDEWQGMGPKPHPPKPSSDEESELKLPHPVDYQKPSVEDETSTLVTENED